MTEPTLGQRILDAAEAYANAVQEAIQTWGAGEWTSHHDEDTAMELDFLRALAARADVAERLAVAVDDFHASCLDIVITRIVPRERDEEAEFKQALAAWRALGEVADG